MSTETKKEYIETREECQSKIDTLGNVCSGCGGKLIPIETVDNSDRPTFWMGCETCSQFDYGVPKINYDIALLLVTKSNFVPYSHMDHPDQRKEEPWYKEYWIRSQVRGAKFIIIDVLRIHKELSQQTEN